MFDVEPSAAPPAAGADIPPAQDAATGAKVDAGKPGGPLPQDVHPAVLEERERAKKYRDIASQAFEFDDAGNVTGIRPELVDQVRQYLPQQPQQPAEDTQVQLDRRLQEYADRVGLLPEQVKGILGLVNAVVQQQVADAQRPLLQSSAEQVKAALATSGEIPKNAVPYVTRWVDEAFAANPTAALTREGRDTILRQALGEYVLTYLRQRRQAPGATGAAPPMLRPAAGPATTGPSPEEQELRVKMGLPATYTKHTPREEV